jgi:hypothetical protein
MDPAYPVINALTDKLVFPLADVPENSWALIPKCSSIKQDYYIHWSQAIYEQAVFVGDLGLLLFYNAYETLIRGEGFSQIWALAQQGVWISRNPSREFPLQFWTPLYATLNHKWGLGEEYCERYYQSRGWFPFKDVMGSEQCDPLPRKWVRLGVSEGEGQLVTHEADSLPYFVPVRVHRAAAA